MNNPHCNNRRGEAHSEPNNCTVFQWTIDYVIEKGIL